MWNSGFTEVSGLRSNRRGPYRQFIPALCVTPRVARARQEAAARTRRGSRTRGRYDKGGPTCLRHEVRAGAGEIAAEWLAGCVRSPANPRPSPNRPETP